MDTNEDYPHQQETFAIIGACMDVHNELGCGFLEAVYQEALSLVFSEKGIPFVREKIMDIHFRGKVLDKKYIADFVCFDKVIVELKATEGLCELNLCTGTKCIEGHPPENRPFDQLWNDQTAIQKNHPLTSVEKIYPQIHTNKNSS